MPGFDKTGPDGEGPKTGKQRGNCEEASSNERIIGSYCCGRGRGFKRGFRCKITTTPTKEEEKIFLESERKEIEKRLKELE